MKSKRKKLCKYSMSSLARRVKERMFLLAITNQRRKKRRSAHTLKRRWRSSSLSVVVVPEVASQLSDRCLERRLR
jgi:hypothetical protein